MEERFVPGAQVVEPGLTGRCADEAILGAAAVAGEAYVAVATELRQQVPLVCAELPLLWRRSDLQHVRLADVADRVVRLHEVVTAVHDRRYVP